MINIWWSILLAAVGIFGLYIATLKLWWGWIISLGAQVLWIVYAIATSQYGFIFSALAYAAVYSKGAISWYEKGHVIVLPPLFDTKDRAKSMVPSEFHKEVHIDFGDNLSYTETALDTLVKALEENGTKKIKMVNKKC